jgi:catechol 2,3-dioxygenase-like lactoylglutathione lyase family enzyme
MPDQAAQGPSVSHLLETSLYVADLARARNFYQKVFGFPAVFEDERMCALEAPGDSMVLLFRRGGSIRPSSTPGGDIPPHDGAGHLHLAFGIPRDTLAQWEAHLEQAAIAVESRVNWPRGGISLYFRDPDGNSVEIATPGLWPGY